MAEAFSIMFRENQTQFQHKCSHANSWFVLEQQDLCTLESLNQPSTCLYTSVLCDAICTNQVRNRTVISNSTESWCCNGPVKVLISPILNCLDILEHTKNIS